MRHNIQETLSNESDFLIGTVVKLQQQKTKSSSA